MGGRDTFDLEIDVSQSLIGGGEISFHQYHERGHKTRKSVADPELSKHTTQDSSAHASQS